ncbi:ankyrin repeat domain-containing protein [archaeon]|nr:MAG: ankyrin repeat domain-containing protein [archaeon]
MDSAALAAKDSSKERTGEIWYCHCCSAKNIPSSKKCRVCGRPDTYGLSGYPLPFHGNYAISYRPAQLIDVLDDIHETDSENWTALHVACANSNTPLVKELLKYKSQIEALTNKGQTALHLATHCGSIECVTDLLKHGAKVNVATYTELETPLHMACSKGFARIAQLLMQAGAG